MLLRNKKQVKKKLINIQIRSKMLLSDESCFRYFNPQDQDEYKWYVENWSNAIHGMLSSVAKKELSTK